MKATIESLAALAIDLVRVNRVERLTREGIDGYLKTRRPGMGFVIWCGNIFLQISRSGIRMFPRRREWEDRELSAFRQLHPDHRAEGITPGSIFIQELPGTSLARLADSGTLHAPMMAAAGRELRRAHTLSGPAWCHGDSHMENFLYDHTDQRCRLIDFETLHEPERSLDWKQADDLLVLLLDLATRPSIAGADRATFIREFWYAYNRPELKTALLDRLAVPRHMFERTLWFTRTHHVPTPTLRERLREIRSAL